jgi:hypothetical protein
VELIADSLDIEAWQLLRNYFLEMANFCLPCLTILCYSSPIAANKAATGEADRRTPRVLAVGTAG